MKAITLVALITPVYSLSSSAQKLPDVQSESLLAPADTKIDGKLTEWGNLKAYNKGTEVFYSLANSKEYLYLVVQATDVDIIDKIIRSGLALTINTDGNKKERKGIMFTYPAFQKDNKKPFLGLYKIKDIKRDKANAVVRTDSLINASNEIIKNEFKFISVCGVTTDTTELLSIYNQEGISLASKFDNNLYYNIELAVPLKLLNGVSKFSYNIQINGYAYKGTNLEAVRDRWLTYIGEDGQRYMLGEPTPRNWSLATPSSFWGEYILAQ